MSLRRLAIEDFRCFSTAELELDSRFNLILGQNASGKTSLLEAFYFLAHGRSFRSARPEPLVRTGQRGFQLTGRLVEQQREIPIGLARQGGQLQARLDGRPVKALAELAHILPVLLIDAEAHRLLDDGPRRRRRFLDWGTFHVEPGFLDTWRRYQRALRQRNSLLREHAPVRSLQAWDQEVSQAGEALDSQRASYLSLLAPVAAALGQAALGLDDVRLEYRRGWAADLSLTETLAAGLRRDRQFGSTQAGPHRAELVIRAEGVRAQDRVSRGQHKVLAASLILAQSRVFSQVTGRVPCLLLDDLAAELDTTHLTRLLDLLLSQPGQLLFTAITPAGLPAGLLQAARVFHVEQGQVRPAVGPQPEG